MIFQDQDECDDDIIIMVVVGSKVSNLHAWYNMYTVKTR